MFPYVFSCLSKTQRATQKNPTRKKTTKTTNLSGWKAFKFAWCRRMRSGACVDESHVKDWSVLGSLCNQSLGPLEVFFVANFYGVSKPTKIPHRFGCWIFLFIRLTIVFWWSFPQRLFRTIFVLNPTSWRDGGFGSILRSIFFCSNGWFNYQLVLGIAMESKYAMLRKGRLVFLTDNGWLDN